MSERSGVPETPTGDRRQQVVARAAQERADQGRTQQAALEQVDQRLASLESALTGERERQDNDSAQLSALMDQLDRMARQGPPGWAQRLAGELEALGEQVAPITELSSLRADARGLVEGVDAALAKIDSLTEAAEQDAARFDEIYQRVDHLHSGVDTAAASIASTEQARTTVNDRAERVEALEQRVAQGLQRLGKRMEEATGRFDGRLYRVELRLDGVDDRISWTSDRLDNLPEMLQTAELHRRLGKLAQRKIPDHSERLASLDERLREAETQLTETVEGVGHEVRARPDQHELGDTVGTIVENAREHTIDRLSALENSVIALAHAMRSGTPTDPTPPSETALVTQVAQGRAVEPDGEATGASETGSGQRRGSGSRSHGKPQSATEKRKTRRNSPSPSSASTYSG